MEMAHEGMIWSLAWHPLGHILCSGSNDHTRYIHKAYWHLTSSRGRVEKPVYSAGQAAHITQTRYIYTLYVYVYTSVR